MPSNSSPLRLLPRQAQFSSLKWLEWHLIDWLCVMFRFLSLSFVSEKARREDFIVRWWKEGFHELMSWAQRFVVSFASRLRWHKRIATCESCTSFGLLILVGWKAKRQTHSQSLSIHSHWHLSAYNRYGKQNLSHQRFLISAIGKYFISPSFACLADVNQEKFRRINCLGKGSQRARQREQSGRKKKAIHLHPALDCLNSKWPRWLRMMNSNGRV